MSERLQILSIIASAVAIVFVVFGGVGSLVLWGESAQCGSRSTAMGFEHSWGPLQGCMINVRGQWLPLTSYRVLQ